MRVEFWLEKLKERECSENTVMNERIVFNWFLKKNYQGRGMFITRRRRTRIFCCETFLEFLSSIKCEKFID
jgi:hypothetical protein